MTTDTETTMRRKRSKKWAASRCYHVPYPTAGTNSRDSWYCSRRRWHPGAHAYYGGQVRWPRVPRFWRVRQLARARAEIVVGWAFPADTFDARRQIVYPYRDRRSQ